MEYWLQQWNEQDSVMQIVMIIFASVALFQILYYWIVFGRVAFYNFKKHAPAQEDFPPVSVIIVAQNSYHHLRKNLTSILEQDYPDFEVVVANDSPTNNQSYFFLKALQENHPALKLIELSEARALYARKKFLIAIATKEASHHIFLFTNVDCKADSKYWIRSMVEKLQENKELVLGYNGLTTIKGFANKFFRLDSVNSSLTYLSLACCGMPYTGTGNNLAYTKKLFTKADGFISHYNLPFGDDSIFINRNATKKNTAVALDADSITRIQTKMTYRQWQRNKKISRLSQKQYKFAHRFVLSLFPFTRFLYYLTFIGLLCLLSLNLLYYSVLGFIALRLFSQIFITKKAMVKFQEKNLLLLAPLLEPLYMILSWGTFLKANFGRKKEYNSFNEQLQSVG